ncbi:MAG: hypothetical protein A2X02_07255 [Bacteroidetes bacterium GWF2_29_10]|nr:MAG: hypothetical protein A2X02_07255 [Bacteroidetes bacterium GWF2_29_10]
MLNKYIKSIFESFKTVNPLVIGDVMLDSYIWGKVDRISPEAPVPIVHISKKENRLGGAANVAINLKELGCNPIICSVIGADDNSNLLKQLFKEHQLLTDGLICNAERLTTQKTRVIGNNFQMIRIDDEICNPVSVEIESILIERVKTIIKKKQINVIVFEDYDKGVLTKNIITSIIKFAKANNIPTVVDPKKRNFSYYKNVTLLKPNFKELKEGLKLDELKATKETLNDVSKELFKLLNNSSLVVTLSEKGIFYIKNESELDAKIFPATVRNIADVSGAGDTVISVLALFVALNIEPYLMTQIANLAGGIVCEEIGTVPINKAKLLKESIKYFAENK